LLRKSKLAVNEAREDRRLVELGSAGTSSRTDHKQLDRKDLDWLASLPPTLIYRDDVFLCHGSPESDTAYRLDGVTEDGKIQARPIEEIETQASGISASLIICGHTHLPRVVRLRNGRLVVNAGSVGCPGYDGTKPVYHKVQAGTPDACYATSSHRAYG
jgi:diadenosine tetraphosphatase ApaH/serine/threonine PP2A family protein phosphatase